MTICGETKSRWITSGHRRLGVSALVVSMLFAGMASAEAFDPEAVRDSLRNIVELQILNAQQLGNSARAQSLYDELATVDLLTAEDLLGYEGVSSQLATLEAKLVELTGMVDELADKGVDFPALIASSPSLEDGSGESDGPQTPNAVGLTAANYDNCTSTRSDGATAQGMLIGIHVAQDAAAVGELVRDVADLACETVVVAIGAAGNPQSLGCSISEGVLNGLRIAEAGLITAYEQYIFCDGIIDGAEIEGCYERAGDNFDLITHVHGDLQTHDEEVQAQQAAHDAAVQAQHAAHDSAMLVQHQTDSAQVSQKLGYLENLVNWVNMIHAQNTNAKVDQVGAQAATIKTLVEQVKALSETNQTLLQALQVQVQDSCN